MNLCKSGLISSRTKSLREKFSRNRSYSELSFKETNTTSSLVSTPTESCAGSLANTTSIHISGSGGVLDLKKHTSNSTNPFFSSDPYCSALNLNAPNFEESRFPWQRDVGIQCDIINVPLVLPLNAKGKKTYKEQQSAKKKTSSSSTSSAASTLINAAAATLRMTGITDSVSNNSNRFWKSSLLLPNLNVSSVSENNRQTLRPSQHFNLRRQKSSRWASASAARKPTLKRAASFDSRGGYARLVQSISSPNSPPNGDNFYDLSPPKSALPIFTTTATNNNNEQLRSSINGNNRSNRLTTDHQSHSTSYLASGISNNDNGFFWNAHSLNNSFRPTALLGASAAVAAAAPFNTTLISKGKSTTLHSVENTVKSLTRTNQNQSFDEISSQSIVDGRRKHSSNEISLKELRRKQFFSSRKQPSSAPDSFDDDSLFSVGGNDDDDAL